MNGSRQRHRETASQSQFPLAAHALGGGKAAEPYGRFADGSAAATT
jgi:hypothetical protein